MRSVIRKTFILAVAAFPASVFAQGLTIQSNTDVRFYGGLATLVNIASRFGGGGSMKDAPQTTYLSGHKLRIESSNTATIIDADAGRFTSIDNKAQTYSSMTFDDMAEMARRAQESAKQEQAKEAANPRKTSKGTKDPNAELNWKYRVETDRPGQREKIAGYQAERIFLTVYVDAEATDKSSGQTEDVGSLVLLLDQWMSKDAPQAAAMAEFSRVYAQKAGQSFKSQTQGLQAAFAAEPRMKPGLEAAAKELAKVQGTALRSTIYFTLLPPKLQFDRALALNEVSAAIAKDDKTKTEDKPKGGGFGGLVGKIKAAAEEANKQDKNNANKKSDPPKQETIATLKDEVTSITSGPVSADLFAPPAGYREIKRSIPPSKTN